MNGTKTKSAKMRAAGRWVLVLLACATLVGGADARASVSVLLEQPYGKLGLIDPSGHSAVYFDHICAEGPTKLRVCRPDELGVVISRYDDVGGYDWLATPVVPYLYGVASVEEIPETMDRAKEISVRDAYRRAHLEFVAPDRPDGTAPDSNWYELVGSAFDRTIYGFRVKTTAAQDAKTIAYFNDSKNKQRYNGLFINCADFVRTTIDRLYPHAIRRNFVADLGLMSPKSAARGLAHYAAKHPDVEFSTFVVPQVPGTLRRSRGNVTLAEGVMKELSPPLLVISPVMTAVAAGAWVTQGRFAMPTKAPVLDLRKMQEDLRARAANPALAAAVVAPAQPGPGEAPVTVSGGADNGPTAMRTVGISFGAH
jgi:hypothetical protein